MGAQEHNIPLILADDYNKALAWGEYTLLLPSKEQYRINFTLNYQPLNDNSILASVRNLLFNTNQEPKIDFSNFSFTDWWNKVKKSNTPAVTTAGGTTETGATRADGSTITGGTDGSTEGSLVGRQDVTQSGSKKSFQESGWGKAAGMVGSGLAQAYDAIPTMDKVHNSNDLLAADLRGTASKTLLLSGNPYAMAVGTSIMALDKTGGFSDASKGLGTSNDAANMFASLTFGGAGYFLGKTSKYNMSDLLRSSSSYTGTAGKGETAMQNSGARIMFGRSKAERMIAEARRRDDSILGILGEARDRTQASTWQGNGYRNWLQLNGGMLRIHTVKNGAKLPDKLNLNKVRSILSNKTGGKLQEDFFFEAENLEENKIDSFKQGKKINTEFNVPSDLFEIDENGDYLYWGDDDRAIEWLKNNKDFTKQYKQWGNPKDGEKTRLVNKKRYNLLWFEKNKDAIFKSLRTTGFPNLEDYLFTTPDGNPAKIAEGEFTPDGQQLYETPEGQLYTMKQGGKSEYKKVKSDKAYYDKDSDTVYYTNDEDLIHEGFHARPDFVLLEQLKPYYENLNDEKILNFGGNLLFVKRFEGDPGHFYSPEELGARIAAAKFRTKGNNYTPEFFKYLRTNENLYGDNMRDLLYMYNDENLSKIFNVGNTQAFKQGGQMNVIPEGALHARKNNMEGAGEDFTHKGIPVLDNEGELQAEIERNEIIFRKEVTSKLEELMKDGSEKAALEAGKLLVEEIFENTDDRTGLIAEITGEEPISEEEELLSKMQEGDGKTPKKSEGGTLDLIEELNKLSPEKLKEFQNILKYLNR